jgi:hypothetical protein
MPIPDADSLLEQLDKNVLAPIPEANRRLMLEWARRELVLGSPIQLATKRMWVDSYTDNGTTVPATWRTMAWRVGVSSPQHPDAVIFAMFDVPSTAEGGATEIHVYSFEPGDGGGVSWFKEKLFNPDTTWGQVTGEALFEDMRQIMATEEENEAIDKAQEAAAERDRKSNGAARAS